jgi:hypothetical protein
MPTPTTATARRALLAAVALAATSALAQHAPSQPRPAQGPAAPPPISSAPTAAAASGAPGAILLTIFLRHDQSKPLPEINAQADKNGFKDLFPPAGVDVVSWYVMMGIGQVVTLRVPPDKLREVNLAIENGAWGAYRSEFYATYDYKPVWEAERARRRK